MNINTDTPEGRDRYNRAVRASLLILAAHAKPATFTGENDETDPEPGPLTNGIEFGNYHYTIL